MQWCRRAAYLLAPLLLLVCLNASPLQAESRRSVERQLKKKLKNQVTYLQKFYRSNRLEFDSAGHLKNSLDATGPWTLYSVIKITDIKVKKHRYIIRRTREVLIYEGGTYESPKLIPSSVELYITLDTESSSSQEDFFEKADRVLYPAETPPEEITPPSYRLYITGAGKDRLKPPPNMNPFKYSPPSLGPPFNVGREISSPTCLSCPDPTYPELARPARIEGRVVLWTIVDESEQVKRIRINKPGGAGLDEAAIEAVKKWKLEPAKYNGQPVPVRMIIEVEFRIY